MTAVPVLSRLHAPSTKFNCTHLNLYSLQKTRFKVCRSFGTKGHNKSELGQDHKSGSTDKKETYYNYVLIVCVVTLYSLQKNTRFVDCVEQKVTTNLKLGQNHKSRSTEEADV